MPSDGDSRIRSVPRARVGQDAASITTNYTAAAEKGFLVVAQQYHLLITNGRKDESSKTREHLRSDNGRKHLLTKIVALNMRTSTQRGRGVFTLRCSASPVFVVFRYKAAPCSERHDRFENTCICSLRRCAAVPSRCCDVQVSSFVVVVTSNENVLRRRHSQYTVPLLPNCFGTRYSLRSTRTKIVLRYKLQSIGYCSVSDSRVFLRPRFLISKEQMSFRL